MTKENEGDSTKTAGQIAYEAAEDESGYRKPWAMLDARAHEYWDRIAAAVRAPLIAAIGTFAASERSRARAKPAYSNMLSAAGLRTEAIRGLWFHAS